MNQATYNAEESYIHFTNSCEFNNNMFIYTPTYSFKLGGEYTATCIALSSLWDNSGATPGAARPSELSHFIFVLRTR